MGYDGNKKYCPEKHIFSESYQCAPYSQRLINVRGTHMSHGLNAVIYKGKRTGEWSCKENMADCKGGGM